MRVLVLTTDATLPRPCLRPTVTGRIAATLTRGNVGYDFVHPARLLGELAVGSHVPLMVVDAPSVGDWLPDVFGELQRRVLGPSRPAVVAVGETLPAVASLRLFASGVSNWLTPAQAPRLLDYWHWVCCQSNADLGGQDVCRRLSLLDEQCAGRDGVFEIADRRLHARLMVRAGRLSIPEVAEFESEFTRTVRQCVRQRLVSLEDAHAPGVERRRPPAAERHRENGLVRDALEQQLQSALRWFLGTFAQTRFIESSVWAPPELLWRAEDLIDDGPLSRYRFAKGFLRHQLRLVANDTATVDVS